MRGVTFNRQTKKWRAVLAREYLGEYTLESNAISARVEAEINRFGKPCEQAGIVVVGDAAHVPIFNRKGDVVALAHIDADDVPLVSGSRWNLMRSGYAVCRIGGKVAHMHRLIVPGDGVVDHMDGVKLNNRRANLRRCSQRENTKNRRTLSKNNSSGFKGVSRVPKGWRARIWLDRREIYIGTFDTPELAARAYDRTAAALHGEFASPNSDKPSFTVKILEVLP